ncbi:MAG: two-component sensor histidine kinase, partial [Syntrophobacteraceae bacterium CG07_land_8_20_14_0_80_61_8]
PFRLAKYFSVSSFAVLLVSSVLLSGFIAHRARDVLLHKSAEYANLVVENLNEQVFYQFTLPSLITDGEIRLSREDQHGRLDRAVRNTIAGFSIEKVEIYNAGGILTYSTEPEPLGGKGALGQAFERAIQGESTSSLEGDDHSFLGFEWPGGTRKLITTMPMWVEKPDSWKRGRVLGAYVITQDVSSDYDAIRNFQLIIVLSFVVFFGVLFATMLFIARRAETILASRAEERKKLEEHLHQTERLAALGEMIAGVSHEIRNPLGIIRSTAELLHGRTDNERQKKLSGIIVQEATRLNNIVTEFLDFARPKTPKKVPCRIEDIINRNLAVLESELRQLGIQVEKDYHSGNGEMPADPDLLYRALVNLLHNAMQAMPEGGRLLVRTGLVMTNSRGEPHLEIRIEDSGGGIPPEVQKKIFNPFFTTREKGTGLGLAIVQSIIDSLDGMIRVESDGRAGTAFIIRLPLAQPELYL